MPRCPNETSDNPYKTKHIMVPMRRLPNGLVYECRVCKKTVVVVGGK